MNGGSQTAYWDDPPSREEGEELYIYIYICISHKIHVTGVFTFMNGLNLW